MPYDLTKIEPLRTDPFPFNELQLAWLADLEKGGKQARSWLKKGDGNCCLGRLCEVAGASWAGGSECYFYNGGPAMSQTIQDSNLREAAGLRDQYGSFQQSIGAATFSSLVSLNDRGAWTFEEIAAYVRHDPWNVFAWPADAATQERQAA